MRPLGISCYEDKLVENAIAQILDQLPEILPGQQGEWDREYVHQKTGEVRWFHVSAFCSDIQGEKKYILVMSDRTKDKKINQALVVDDDFDTCDSVTKMLLRVGMRSEWTVSGKEAVMRARQAIEVEAKAAGVTVFCSKPMFMSDLRDSLLNALGQWYERIYFQAGCRRRGCCGTAGSI